MAIANSDGSITLSTKVDTSGINQGVSSMKGIIGKLGGVMAAAFSVKMISNFAKESKNLYKIQMQNEVKLATVMRQRINATDEQIQKILDLTAAEQGLGIIGDEVQLAGLQQLATFAKQQETIESLLPAMNNLIAQQYGFEASTESARNVANLMGKVLQGQTGALTRVGITFTEAQEQVLKYGNESERAATLAQVITDNVGDMNKALAKTDSGRQQQLANTIGDIKEQFGQAVTQIEIYFLPVLKTLANVLSQIAVIFRAATNKLVNDGKEINSEWEEINANSSQTAENIEDQVNAQKELNKEMKKTLAGFDDIQILSANTADNTGGGLDGGLQGIGGDLGGNAPDGSSYVEEANATILAITSTIESGLIAIGLILLLSGQVAWGLGFIIGGAALLSITAASIGGTDIDSEAKTRISEIMGIVGISAIAIGLLLLFLGQVPWGLGFIAFGAGAEGISQVFATESTEDIQSSCDAIISFLSGLTAYLIANALLSNFSTFVTLWGNFRAFLQLINTEGFLNTIISLLGGSLSTIQLWAIAIGVLVAGIAYLAVNWDKLSPAQQTITILTSLAAAATAAAVAIALFHTSWSVGIAAATIAAGVALLAGTYLFKSYNGKKDLSGSGQPPSSIDQYSYLADASTYKIPALAKGAVLPAGKPFLAVVGDQRSGTNVEAPLDTIVEAMNIALRNNGTGQTQKEEHYYLSDTEVMRIIYKMAKGGERLEGKSLVTGGSF